VVKQAGATFGSSNGSHLKVELNGKTSILPDAQQRSRHGNSPAVSAPPRRPSTASSNLRHASKIDGIADAMKALGKTLEIRAA